MIGRLRWFLASVFLTQKKPEKAGYVFNTAHHFLYGLTVYKKKTRLAIPIEFILLVSSVTLLSSLLQALIDIWKTKWLDVLCFYLTMITPVVCSLTVLLHRERIRTLSEQVDGWWNNHPHLMAETMELKRRTAARMDRFNYYYLSAMYMGAACCGLLPFQKNNSSDQMEPMDGLILPMWMPFSNRGFWPFFIASFLQVLTLWFAFFTFSRLCSYVMTVSITISYQMKLVGRAYQTSGRRVKIVMKNMDITDNNIRIRVYTELMAREIKSCFILYQQLYGNALELRTTFSLLTNLTYHAGMWAVCLFGVMFVKDKENPYIFIRVSSAIVSVLGNQYLYSHVSEALTDELENLRLAVYSFEWYELPIQLQKDIHLFQTMLLYIPTLRTIMGTKTNMENLSQIVSASYCYFSMILSFKSKYSA